MLIKYLKDTHDSFAGDVKEVPDEQANVLILLEVAEAVPEKKTTTKKQG